MLKMKRKRDPPSPSSTVVKEDVLEVRREFSKVRGAGVGTELGALAGADVGGEAQGSRKGCTARKGTREGCNEGVTCARRVHELCCRHGHCRTSQHVCAILRAAERDCPT